jgi:hypothetical protein
MSIVNGAVAQHLLDAGVDQDALNLRVAGGALQELVEPFG